MIIVSGGQTGVDQAALDVALSLGLQVDGWCPCGRKAEDGRIPRRYALRETTTSYYVQRTRLNVRDSDATLVLDTQRRGGGTALTRDFAVRTHKPVCWVDLEREPLPSPTTMAWLLDTAPLRLNVAGPRASQGDDVYRRAFRYGLALFEAYRHSVRFMRT